MRNRIFSTDSPKAIKANKFGYINAIHYMAPHKSAGVGNLCSHASLGCIALCLGEHSGAAIYYPAVIQSRRAKAQRFMRDRARYLLDMVRAIDALIVKAKRMRKKLALRLNGSTDVAYEGIRFTIHRNPFGRAIAVTLGGPEGKTFFAHYPDIPFPDYTKNPRRFDRTLPANYCLTFSHSETNESDCLRLLERGVNVAVVFAGDKPLTWNGFTVIDGDTHDLRHLDPRAGNLVNGHSLSLGGYVIALSPKGYKAKRDSSGFVVR
jgi:hypothetical protein